MASQVLPSNIQQPPSPPPNLDQAHTIINIELSNQPPALTLACSICLENYPQKDFSSFDACHHSFCNNCLREYLKENINSLKVLTMHCPQEGCQTKLTDKEIQGILDKQAFETYQKLALQKLAVSKGRHRLCPMPGCARTYSISKKLPYAKCKCGGLICNICGEQWHEGKSCLDAIDSEFKLYSTQHEIKFCMVCKTPTKRVEGCRHMTCPVCDYEWCWDCGRQYNPRHASSCPFVWSPNPPDELRKKIWNERWAQTNIVVKILIIIILIIISPILAIGFILLWPFFSFNVKKELSIKRPFSSICKIFSCLLVGILMSPIFLFGILILVFFVVLLFPCIIAGIYSDRKEQARNMAISAQRHSDDQIRTKRWITGDPLNFKFTLKKNQNPNPNIGTIIVPMPVDGARQGQA